MSSDRVLIVRTVECTAPNRELFEVWQDRFAYDTLQLEGVSTGRRYQRTNDPNAWIVYHDVDASQADAVLANEQERLATEADSLEALGLALHWNHQVYRAVETLPMTHSQDLDIAGPIANFVWWTPRAGTEEELGRWYDEEHLPLLMSVPGWLRIRRFELVGDRGPRYLAIHDIAGPHVFGHPQQRKARTTPWRARVLADRLQYSSVGYTLGRIL